MVIQETRDMRKASWMEDIMVVRGPGALILLCGNARALQPENFFSVCGLGDGLHNVVFTQTCSGGRWERKDPV